MQILQEHAKFCRGANAGAQKAGEQLAPGHEEWKDGPKEPKHGIRPKTPGDLP